MGGLCNRFSAMNKEAMQNLPIYDDCFFTTTDGLLFFSVHFGNHLLAEV